MFDHNIMERDLQTYNGYPMVFEYHCVANTGCSAFSILENAKSFMLGTVINTKVLQTLESMEACDTIRWQNVHVWD